MAHEIVHTGAIHVPIAGRTDHIPVSVPGGAYVLPADTVSALGEGNTLAGSKILDHMFSTGPYGSSLKGGKHPYASGGNVPAPTPIIVAGGEYILTPEQVRSIGKGDLDAGHKILDKFVTDIRAKTIKTLKKLPGPKKS